MKIDATNHLPESQPLDGGRPAGSRGASRKLGLVGDAASISLGPGSVSSLRARLAGVPDIRHDRVQALREAIQSGSFNASNEQIADAMHSEFFGTDAKQ